MGVRDPKKQWFLTYPQTTLTMAILLERLKEVDTLEEYVIAEEKHKDGNLHLHAYAKYTTGVVLKDAPDVFTFFPHLSGNYQPARSAKAVIKYCTKEGNYLSSFDVPSYLNKKKKLDVSTIKTKTARQALEDGDIGIASIRNYNLARSILVDEYTHDSVRGLWIYGPPGTGKSTAVRAEFPSLFLKQQNKWFDGYAGEKAILIDDLDTNVLGHYLKIWSDKFACTGEIKGGMCQLQHETFIVTSNYSIRELFYEERLEKVEDLCTGDWEFRKVPVKGCEVLCEALERRFRVVHKTSFDVPIN